MPWLLCMPERNESLNNHFFNNPRSYKAFYKRLATSLSGSWMYIVHFCFLLKYLWFVRHYINLSKCIGKTPINNCMFYVVQFNNGYVYLHLQWNCLRYFQINSCLDWRYVSRYLIMFKTESNHWELVIQASTRISPVSGAMLWNTYPTSSEKDRYLVYNMNLCL